MLSESCSLTAGRIQELAQAPCSTHSTHTPRPEVSPSLEVVHALENFRRTVTPLPEICRHEEAPLLRAACGPLQSSLGALPQPSHPKTILSPCPPTWLSWNLSTPRHLPLKMSSGTHHLPPNWRLTLGSLFPPHPTVSYIPPYQLAHFFLPLCPYYNSLHEIHTGLAQ